MSISDVNLRGYIATCWASGIDFYACVLGWGQSSPGQLLLGPALTDDIRSSDILKGATIQGSELGVDT